MFRLIRQKIKNKMWLTICLVLGVSFLVAAFCCQPMFKEGSQNKLLLNLYEDFIEKNNQYPTVIGRGGSYNTESKNTVEQVVSGIEDYEATWTKYLDEFDIIATQTRLKLSEETSQGSLGSKGNYISISHMPDMSSHIQMLVGETLEEYTNEDASVYPCIMSQGVMDQYGLTLGETLDFVNWKDTQGISLKLKIVGIFKESDVNDLFWYKEPNEFEKEVFVTEDDFNKILSRYNSETIYYSHYVLLDYEDINSSNVEELQYYVDEFSSVDDNFYETTSSIFAEYKKGKTTINITLWVLELPIFGMVIAFIYMVSKQIMETEKNEIAMMKSRGFNRKQVILLYAIQSGFLSVAGVFLGIPLGYFLCKMAASTTDFLTFDGKNLYMYNFTPVMLVYGVVAALIAIMFILIPVVTSSGISIVEHKSNYNHNARMMWEKYFLDIVFLLVSLYLVYNFNQDQENIRQKAILGNKMDPMIFLDSILFIIAFGLVALRITHYIVRLVYKIGKKKWRPEMYASFLQITRTFGRQGFISVFMILTVSLGLFNANAARTINRNNEDRIVYESGTDITLMEKWRMEVFYVSPQVIDYEYIEPDYLKYEELVKSGQCESITRVIEDDKTIVSKGSKTMTDCMLMGINTKEFGETAYLKEELNQETHWYTYLNEMALRTNGVIISRNLADSLQVDVGDSIKCTRMCATTNQKEQERGIMNGNICAIVDAWPGYDQYYYDEQGKLQENYLVVANYATVVKSYRISPYSVWMKLSPDVEATEIRKTLENMEVDIETFVDVDKEILDMKGSSLIQITNGMFTLSFIIAIILCAVGFLIYWISSIRQRELLFGVYRAMGMSVKEVNRMLVNEHVFSTFLSVIAGGGVGMVTTLLFVKLFGIIYLPEKHNLDIYIYFEISDVVKLAVVIAVMILVCMLVLRRLIRTMNITQALKLGEE